MSKDQTWGACILGLSILGIIVYAVLLYLYPQPVLQITALVAVAGILGIAAWIGWTMATTPPPPPLEVPEAQPASALEPSNPQPKQSHGAAVAVNQTCNHAPPPGIHLNCRDYNRDRLVKTQAPLPFGGWRRVRTFAIIGTMVLIVGKSIGRVGID